MRGLLMMTAMTALSCAKPLPPIDPDAPTGDEELVPMVFSANGNANPTKPSLQDFWETKIDHWAVFAFDDASGWVAYGTSSSASPIQMKLRAHRDYTIYAVVNYPTSGLNALTPSGVRTPHDLTDKVSYLSDNSTSGGFMMFGSTPLTPSASNYNPTDVDGTFTPEPVSITVTRLVSRMDVTQVAVDFRDKPHLLDKPFTLKSIYLTNLYTTSRYGSDYLYDELSAASSAWYNAGGWHTSRSNPNIDALVGNTGINQSLSTYARPYAVVNSFYAYPNATPVGSDTHQMSGPWTPRCTRIVIEAEMGGDTMYYQINVPGMARNHIYSVSNVVIRGVGSKDPEVIDYWEDSLDITYTIVTSEWDGTYNVSENS